MSEPRCKVLVLALADAQSSIATKVRRVASSLGKYGFEAAVCIGPRHLWKGPRALRQELYKVRPDAVIVRSGYAIGLMLPALVAARRRGVRLILEVPTPYRVGIREVLTGSGYSKTQKIVRLGALLLEAPALWLLFHTILQIAPEGKYFEFPVRSRIRRFSNGVDVADLKHWSPPDETAALAVVGVGTLSGWHGYDRLIRGLGRYYRDKRPLDRSLTLHVVGQGPDAARLSALAAEEGVEHLVRFHGALWGSELDDVFAASHAAVGSLALHRIDHHVISPLKTREYCARGIPFMMAGDDPAFDGPLEFIYRVPADDSTVDVAALIPWLTDLRGRKDLCDYERSYARDHCDAGAIYGSHIEASLGIRSIHRTFPSRRHDELPTGRNG